MAGSRLTGFEQVLIGLIVLQPRSGYDLKRHFASSPANLYQPSSGALYPALRRLERQGLLQQVTPEVAERGGTGRRRHVYQVTPEGREAHIAWICEPVSAATVAQDLAMHLMRFVMMENELPRHEVVAFLSSLQAALADFVSSLERFEAAPDPGEVHGPLAIGHGIAVYRASLDWTARTIAVLTGPTKSLSVRQPA